MLKKCESDLVRTVPDDYEQTKKMILYATNNYAVVITTDFHSVVIRPGKPVEMYNLLLIPIIS